MRAEGRTWEPIELSFTSTYSYQDPFWETELDLIVRDKEGCEWKVPCFWAGRDLWKARFSAPHAGAYDFETVCLNEEDMGLHGCIGTIYVKEYDGENPLYVHGPIEIMENRRYFMYHDGTPFPWLGDTWWPLECSRLSEDGEVQCLAKDRAEKGFNLVHVVNGFWCDVAPYDKRLANAAGFAWTENFGTINPEYFNIADKKIQIVADAGLVIAMAAAWGFYISFMGLEKMKKHMRYTIARYGAYSTVWLTAGEAAGEYYDLKPQFGCKDPKKTEAAVEAAKRDWTEVMRYMKEIDPFRRLATVHPTFNRTSMDDILDSELLDFVIYQAGRHDGDHEVITEHINRQTKRGLELLPKRPVLNSETCYEGMLYHQCGPELQRWIFWHSVLDGCAGWTYGANGIFNMSHENDPFGACYYGIIWGEQTWQEAMDFEGARQVGAGRKYLNNYEWWKLTPAADLIDNALAKDEYEKSVAAHIEDDLIIAYMQRFLSRSDKTVNPYCMRFIHLTPGICYRVKAYNPIRNYEITLGSATVEADGRLSTPVLPILQDWVIILEREAG